MGTLRNLEGRTFGRLYVRERAPDTKSGTMWTCECSCGRKRIVSGRNLIHKRQVSCGCWKNELSAKRLTKHGQARRGRVTPTYRAWLQMRQSCTCEAHARYWEHSSLGITVDPRWDAFTQFLSDMGEKPAGKMLERIDPALPYEPGNCAWVQPPETGLFKRRVQVEGAEHDREQEQTTRREPCQTGGEDSSSESCAGS